MLELVSYYKENATILRKTFKDMGFSVYGGENAPYVWVGFPGQASWDVFADILHKCNIVTTPGSGFGPAGEGFVRASAFGHRCAPFTLRHLVLHDMLSIASLPGCRWPCPYLVTLCYLSSEHDSKAKAKQLISGHIELISAEWTLHSHLLIGIRSKGDTDYQLVDLPIL